MNNGIYIYEALSEMRKISEENGTFSLVFCSYSRSRHYSEGLVHISSARLRKAEKREDRNVVLFTDMTTLQAKKCYLPLIIEFNERAVYLNKQEHG